MNQSLFDQDNDSFDILLIVVAVVGKQTIQSIQQLLVLVLVVVQLIVLLLVNYYYHSPHPFNRIYQSISLLCRTGSFTLSLSLFFLSLFTCRSDLVCVLLSPPPSIVYIYPSLYIVSHRIFPSLFTCCCGRVLARVLYLSVSSYSYLPDLFPSLYVSLRFVCVLLLSPPLTVSIYPSVYRVILDLFLSLYILFFVQPYRVFLSLFTSSFGRIYLSVS